MKRYVLAIVFVGLFVVQGYSQDNQSPSGQDTPQVATEAPALAPAASEKSAQPEEISIYGEIKAVNQAASSIMVQYYDYDSDQEKSIEITADTNTKIENVATINNIKQDNWADIIYAIINGKNIAKSIVVEKEEDTPAETPKAEENVQQ